jgi:hypothetical protein
MSKLIFVALFVLLAVSYAQNTTSANVSDNSTAASVNVSAPVNTVSLSSVFSNVDTYLRKTYWYYLRSATILYQANIDTAG